MKKSTTAPKLSLHRETIRVMTSHQLTLVTAADGSAGHLCISVLARVPCDDKDTQKCA